MMIMQCYRIDNDDGDEQTKYDAAALVLMIDEWRKAVMILEAREVKVNAAVLDR